jgi:Ca2+-binding EF-hand superfamily protein
MKHTGFIAAVMASGIMLSAGVALAQGPGGMHHRGQMSFEMLDVDGNGEISQDEFEARHETMFNSTDSDGDGMLSRDEMIAAGQKWLEARVDAMLEGMDENGDGMLALDEMPGPRDSKRAGRFFDRMDGDDSGSIDKAEFDAARERMEEHGMKRGEHRGWKN